MSYRNRYRNRYFEEDDRRYDFSDFRDDDELEDEYEPPRLAGYEDDYGYEDEDYEGDRKYEQYGTFRRTSKSHLTDFLTRIRDVVYDMKDDFYKFKDWYLDEDEEDKEKTFVLFQDKISRAVKDIDTAAKNLVGRLDPELAEKTGIKRFFDV